MANKPFNIDQLYRKGFQDWEAPYNQAEVEQSWEKVQQSQGSGSGGSESATGTGSAGSSAGSSFFQGALTGLKGWLVGASAALIVGSGAFYVINTNSNNDEQKQEKAEADTEQNASAEPQGNSNKSTPDKNGSDKQATTDQPDEESPYISDDESNSSNAENGRRGNQSGVNEQQNSGSLSNNLKQKGSDGNKQVKDQVQRNSDESHANHENERSYENAVPSLTIGKPESTINSGPRVILSDKIICESEPLQISIKEFEPFHRATYNKGNTDYKSIKEQIRLTWDESGKYDISFKLMNKKSGDTRTMSKTIQVRGAPKANFGYSNNGYQVGFKNFSKGATNYRWFFGDGESSIDKQPTHTFKRKGEKQVFLVAISKNGCKDTMTKQPYIEGRPPVEIPDIFTPNGDGKNDEFIIQNLKDVEQYQLLVRDNQGRKVFEANRPSEYWNGLLNNDGPECESGRYQFVLKYRFPEHVQVKEKRGTILLKRK